MRTDGTPGRWTRVVRPGYCNDEYQRGRKLDVWVTIEWSFQMNQKWELSITAVEGPKANGDAWGSCGQCVTALDRIEHFYNGWDRAMVDRLRDIWGRWHLNGMRAGSPAQEAWLQQNPITAVYPESYYVKAKTALAEAGLNPDPNYFHPTKTRELVSVVGFPAEMVREQIADVPYEYGTAWIYEDVPQDVLDWLYELPPGRSDNKPMPVHPWGDHDQQKETE